MNNDVVHVLQNIQTELSCISGILFCMLIVLALKDFGGHKHE